MLARKRNIRFEAERWHEAHTRCSLPIRKALYRRYFGRNAFFPPVTVSVMLRLSATRLRDRHLDSRAKCGQVVQLRANTLVSMDGLRWSGSL